MITPFTPGKLRPEYLDTILWSFWVCFLRLGPVCMSMCFGWFHNRRTNSAFQGHFLARKLRAGTGSTSIWYEFTGSELRIWLPFQGTFTGRRMCKHEFRVAWNAPFDKLSMHQRSMPDPSFGDGLGCIWPHILSSASAYGAIHPWPQWMTAYSSDPLCVSRSMYSFTEQRLIKIIKSFKLV
jgi:hypothetical protein